ncbi:MAG: flagellar protein FlaG [Burkholderiaceae bacterium]|nr:flagellar protein FlaG [Burkholderiaceae bacterium]
MSTIPRLVSLEPLPAPVAPAPQRPAPASGAGRTAAPVPSPPPDAALMERARSEANRALAQKGRELSFEFDRELGRVIVKLVDTNTREVIRQVPSEELLAIARALAEGADAGVLVRGQG